MNRYLTGYSIVIWIGIFVNALFWVPAFFAPNMVINTFNIEGDFWTIWLRNVGMLLLLVALFNAAAALAPSRYPMVSWLVVLSRFIASAFFLEVWLLNSRHSSDRPEVFMWLFITDFSFGTVKGVLLNLALPKDSRLRITNLLGSEKR